MNMLWYTSIKRHSKVVGEICKLSPILDILMTIGRQSFQLLFFPLIFITFQLLFFKCLSYLPVKLNNIKYLLNTFDFSLENYHTLPTNSAVCGVIFIKTYDTVV